MFNDKIPYRYGTWKYPKIILKNTFIFDKNPDIRVGTFMIWLQTNNLLIMD